ncbi:hypothetical protein AWB73_03338 [Caballeronia turbans]|uniref:hypothetical protein n=1 Tax=Caballeronia sp. INML2 TaxID=2921748 RepID=UPI00074C1AB5|nr:hypothetical protein [Caballeronia sp. INML2]SAL35110.1 hypothetical protein AWB73_03338 [Caballeronia turbans]
MNRPEYSLSLDSVICQRCNTVSPAEEETCPSCGADRQGAIFTSRTETRASVPVPAQLDIVDWDDSHWLQRLVRRRMLTSYPNFIEPGDLQEQRRKSAHTAIAVLVGGVVASIAVGAYFYARLDDNAPPPSDDPGISVAGSVHDRASAAPGANTARQASLMRSKADSTNAQAVTPASSANHAREEHASVSPGAPAAAHATTQTTSVAPRVEPRVAVASMPASVSTVAAAAPAKPPVPAAPAAPTAHATASPPSPGIAPTTAVASAKPATTNATTSSAAAAGASVAAAAPPIKPSAPVVASTQKAEPHASTTLSAAIPIPAKPSAQAPAQATPVARTAEPPRSIPAIAAAEKPAARPAQPAAEPLPAAVARSIAALQQALAARDLTAARRHMRGLYASEPRSPEIQQIAAELSRQERARDSAMASARTCAANMDPACALRNARRAVALDPRNGQTQATLRRALAVQNETNTEYFRQASGIPKPIVPTMTFDGRWSAGNRHPAMSADDDDSRYTPFGLGVPVVSKGRNDAH